MALQSYNLNQPERCDNVAEHQKNEFDAIHRLIFRTYLQNCFIIEKSLLLLHNNL